MEHHRQGLGRLRHEEPFVPSLGGLQSDQSLPVADDPPEVPGDRGGQLDGGGSLHGGAVGEDGEGEDPGGEDRSLLAGAETVMDQLCEVRGDQGWAGSSLGWEICQTVDLLAALSSNQQVSIYLSNLEQ